MKLKVRDNDSPKAILLNMLLAAFSLFVNGFGIYLTIQANIGAAPWDVLNIGLSKTFGILYGTASIAVSITILIIDILMREPIGIAMIIDSIVVGKSVDFFNYLNIVPKCSSLISGMLLMLVGFFVIAFTQYTYMMASLGCGPRDTLLVGLKKRFKKVPIGVMTIVIFTTVTLVGYLLGGPVGIGTLICAFGLGPIMQLVFDLEGFDATRIEHQRLRDSLKVLFRKISINH